MKYYIDINLLKRTIDSLPDAELDEIHFPLMPELSIVMSSIELAQANHQKVLVFRRCDKWKLTLEEDVQNTFHVANGKKFRIEVTEDGIVINKYDPTMERMEIIPVSSNQIEIK